MKSVTDETFTAEVLQSDTLVLVDFWAEWCRACLIITAVLEEIATELAARIRIVTLDADLNPRAAIEYAVTRVPTLTLFRDGVPIRSLVGARPKSEIVQWIESSTSS